MKGIFNNNVVIKIFSFLILKSYKNIEIINGIKASIRIDFIPFYIMNAKWINIIE